MAKMFYDATPPVFANARNLRHKMTEAEKVLWDRVSKKQILNHRFRRQHPVGRFIADFYCHQAKLVIEVDGEVHDHPDRIEYDAERTRELEAMKIRVMRFTNHQVFSQLEEVIETIKGHLNSNTKASPLGEVWRGKFYETITIKHQHPEPCSGAVFHHCAAAPYYERCVGAER